MVTTMNRNSSTNCLAEYAFAMELDVVAEPVEGRSPSVGHFICTWQDAFSSEGAAQEASVRESGGKTPSASSSRASAHRSGGKHQTAWPPSSLEREKEGAAYHDQRAKDKMTRKASADIKG
mmetsp:Transcript_23699/g.46007  ORF Transcript_23699/g.46007 Transcript_23699/m.46007 type:complete len:121 (-) Transcript_23699:221-583(-)